LAIAGTNEGLLVFDFRGSFLKLNQLKAKVNTFVCTALKPKVCVYIFDLLAFSQRY